LCYIYSAKKEDYHGEFKFVNIFVTLGFPLFQYSIEKTKAIPNTENGRMVNISCHELKREFNGKALALGKKSIEQE
jgi:hypothetical protein